MSSFNLVEWLTELRDTSYLQPDEREAWNTVCGEDRGARLLSEHGTLSDSPHVYHPGSSPNSVLLTLLTEGMIN